MEDPKEEFKPDGRSYEEAARLWGEDRSRRHDVMGSMVESSAMKSGIYYLLLNCDITADSIRLAQRAAWLGYCIGAGLIKEDS